MAEYYATRTCDICGDVVAKKKHLIFKAYQNYTKVKFHRGREDYFFCGHCYSDVCHNLRERLEERRQRNEH